jgi:heptosyltransferase-1
VRILIIRTSALGDVVHALPVLRALRKALPDAHLGWVVEESIAPLLAGHPDLDEILPVALRRWGRAPLSRPTQRQALAFLRRLRAFRADVALDLMGNHKAAVLARLSGARRRIGAQRRDRREPSSALWLGRGIPIEGVHAVDRGLSLLAGLSIDPGPADFGPDRLLPDVAPASSAHPYLLIHPGAGWGNKRYPPAWWGEVAHRLHTNLGIATQVAVAPGEEDLAATIEAASLGAATRVEAPDLRSLTSLLRGARLVLGGDTGPLHLAHALGTPVLMLLGPTDPARNGPYGAPGHAFFRQLVCSYCYRRFDQAKVCLLELRPVLVCERAAALCADANSDPAAVKGFAGSSLALTPQPTGG